MYYRLNITKELRKPSVKIALFACLVSACAVALVVVACFVHPRTRTFIKPNVVMTLVGLVFSIVGVVATVFFVVLSFRAGLIYDDIKTAGCTIQEQMKKEKKIYQELVYETYEALCDNYSRLINDCPEKVGEYKLSEARMACKLFLLPQDKREEKIRLLSEIERCGATDDEIDDDIMLLKTILYDEKEEKAIREAALESIDVLKKRKEQDLSIVHDKIC